MQVPGYPWPYWCSTLAFIVESNKYIENFMYIPMYESRYDIADITDS